MVGICPQSAKSAKFNSLKVLIFYDLFNLSVMSVGLLLETNKYLYFFYKNNFIKK